MTVHAPGVSPAGSWLDRDAVRRLELRLDAALRRARTTGTPALASVTCPVGPQVDPTAIVVGSRRPGEPWFALEQPDRDGSALAALGCVRSLEGRGTGRFGDVARRWADVTADAFTDDLDGPPGSGLVV